MIRRIVTYAVAIIVAVYVARQARKPDKWIGRPFLWLMNLSHSELTDWVRDRLQSREISRCWISNIWLLV